MTEVYGEQLVSGWTDARARVLGGMTALPSRSASGLRAFEAIADRWNLSRHERQAALGMPLRTYNRVRARPETAMLDDDTLERISHVLGIYKALHVLFEDDERADTWINRPSLAFAGQPARALIASGLFTDLVRVRQHLDAARVD